MTSNLAINTQASTNDNVIIVPMPMTHRDGKAGVVYNKDSMHDIFYKKQVYKKHDAQISQNRIIKKHRQTEFQKVNFKSLFLRENF